MKRSHARQLRMYRWFTRLAPKHHRQRHGRAQAQLFADLLQTGHRPWRLWAAAIPDLFAVLLTYRRRTVLSHLARLGLFPLSLLNAAVGLGLAGASVATGAIPVWVALPAAAIAGQGVYTVAWLTGRLPGPARAGTILFAIGEAVALVVGASGVVAAVIAQSAASHPEYGPPTMLTLVAGHGIVGLLAVPTAPDRPVVAAS